MALEFAQLTEMPSGEIIWVNRQQIICYISVTSTTSRIMMNDQGTCLVASSIASLNTALNYVFMLLLDAFVQFTLASPNPSKAIYVARRFVSRIKARDTNSTLLRFEDGSEVVVVGNLATVAGTLNFTL
jgi:competence transcription factor ComK